MAEEALTWEEVKSASKKIFNVWTYGREMEWAELAWEGLTTSGLTIYRDELEKTTVLLRLAVLGVFYREFCTQAWDEWNDPEVEYWLEDFDIEPFRIAQLVGPAFRSDQLETQEALVKAALDYLLLKERGPVRRALKEYFGGTSMLFASLWATNFDFVIDEEDESEPGNDEDEDDYDHGDGDGYDNEPTLRAILDDGTALYLILNDPDYMSEERMQAFSWVEEGMLSINFERAEYDGYLRDDEDDDEDNREGEDEDSGT